MLSYGLAFGGGRIGEDLLERRASPILPQELLAFAGIFISPAAK
jgi:hypothetical protein